jgi:hypothetical protein
MRAKRKRQSGDQRFRVSVLTNKLGNYGLIVGIGSHLDIAGKTESSILEHITYYSPQRRSQLELALRTGS